MKSVPVETENRIVPLNPARQKSDTLRIPRQRAFDGLDHSKFANGYLLFIGIGRQFFDGHPTGR